MMKKTEKDQTFLLCCSPYNDILCMVRLQKLVVVLVCGSHTRLHYCFSGKTIHIPGLDPSWDKMMIKEMTNSFLFSQDLDGWCCSWAPHCSPRNIKRTRVFCSGHIYLPAGPPLALVLLLFMGTSDPSIQYLFSPLFMVNRALFFLSCCEFLICGGNCRHSWKKRRRSDDVGIGKTRLHTHQIFHNVSWSISFIQQKYVVVEEEVKSIRGGTYWKEITACTQD